MHLARGIKSTIRMSALLKSMYRNNEREEWHRTMALIRCPECGGKLSDLAKVCIHCGYPLAEIRSTSQEQSLFTKVGSIVTFGMYPQAADGEDHTPIEWQVLDYDRQNSRALLLSVYGLDVKPYNSNYVWYVTWEDCTLRAWLNNDFLKSAFTTNEQARIGTTLVKNTSDQVCPRWDLAPDENLTQDRIFLLSYAEANRYLKVTYSDDENIKPRMVPTEYAIKNGADASKEDYMKADSRLLSSWWLRSSGGNPDRKSYVMTNGSLDDYEVNDRKCVRPALWIKLSDNDHSAPYEEIKDDSNQKDYEDWLADHDLKDLGYI